MKPLSNASKVASKAVKKLSETAGAGAQASLLSYVDDEEADEGPEWYHRESSSSSLSQRTPAAAARALLPTLASHAGAARADGRATLGAPTDLYGLTGLLQSHATAHDTAMKRMEAAIVSLVSVQAKHSQALARIEALAGQVRKRVRVRVRVRVCVCVCVASNICMCVCVCVCVCVRVYIYIDATMYI
jgi:hypothetical protein